MPPLRCCTRFAGKWSAFISSWVGTAANEYLNSPKEARKIPRKSKEEVAAQTKEREREEEKKQREKRERERLRDSKKREENRVGSG